MSDFQDLLSDDGGRREPIQGRRRRRDVESTDSLRKDIRSSDSVDQKDLDESKSRRPQTAAKSGWGEEGATSGARKGRRSGPQSDQNIAASSGGDIDDERERDSRNQEGRNGGTYTNQSGVMIVIPDLADVEDEEMITAVAAPPSVKVNRVKAIRELDSELAIASTFSNDLSTAGIDLSALTAIALCPPEQVNEDDRHWEWDTVFTEITSTFAEIESTA